MYTYKRKGFFILLLDRSEFRDEIGRDIRVLTFWFWRTRRPFSSVARTSLYRTAVPLHRAISLLTSPPWGFNAHLGVYTTLTSRDVSNDTAEWQRHYPHTVTHLPPASAAVLSRRRNSIAPPRVYLSLSLPTTTAAVIIDGGSGGVH